jgi:peptidase E
MSGNGRLPAIGTPVPRVLALGGHEFGSRPPDRAVCELLLRLASERGGGRPRICILPTPGADASEQIAGFYAAFGERSCEPSDASPFQLGRRQQALRDQLLRQDLIYVGGGSLVDLLALWEARDVASILDLAWRQGTVLAGQGAGAMCWFEAGITGSSGRPLVAAGLGLLPGSLCVHYNNQPERRAAYLDAVADGMPSGYGLDDYAGLLCEGGGAPSALTARRGARAYRVIGQGGEVTESALPARFLPAPAPAALREDIAEFRRIKALRKRAGWLG